MNNPIPRPAVSKNVSGMEINRISTKIVAREPRAMRMSDSGTVAGSSMPASRSASRISVASPAKKTSLPSAPVCQPVTESVSPSAWLPAYQSVNAEIAWTRPATHASRSPQ
jgi:hypothetical protein